MIAVTFVLVIVIGFVDFLTGFELSLLVFYLLPVCLAVAAVGWGFGVATALVSVGTWLAGDLAAGARFANPLVPCWNAIIALGIYLVVIWLLASVLALQREMEERVRQRTVALTEEIAERERLEKALLEIGQRERRSVGHDLHDGLGQHLTGTSLVAQALRTRLLARQAEEAADMGKIVELIDQGIEQTRSLARGLLLAQIEPNGLVIALQELADSISRQFRVACEFDGDSAVDLAESGTATHIYRIAQEALRNAVRHGRARRLRVGLAGSDGTLTLTVRDDGIGLPPPESRGQGLGLRIMAHRAAIIGAIFTIEARPEGGTLASCRLPPAPSP